MPSRVQRWLRPEALRTHVLSTTNRSAGRTRLAVVKVPLKRKVNPLAGFKPGNDYVGSSMSLLEQLDKKYCCRFWRPDCLPASPFRAVR